MPFIRVTNNNNQAHMTHINIAHIIMIERDGDNAVLTITTKMSDGRNHRVYLVETVEEVLQQIENCAPGGGGGDGWG